MNPPYSLWHRTSIALLIGALLLSTAITAELLTLMGNDVVDSYPFMWPDSFDWIANGLYYLETFGHNLSSEVPTIRQPLFPLLIAAAYLLEAPQLLLILLQLAFLFTLWVVYKLFRSLAVRPPLVCIALLILIFHHALNSFRLYLMADTIACFLLCFSTLLYLKVLRDNPRMQTVQFPACVAGIGSLFQFYALFPSLAASASLALVGFWKKERKFMVVSIYNFLVTGLFQGGWIAFKWIHFGSPTATSVSQFGLLQLNFGNSEFYWETWRVLFFPVLIPVLLLIPWIRPRRAREVFDRELFFLGVLIAISFSSIFFYQWKEARFTILFFPLAVVFFFSVFDRLIDSSRRTPNILLVVVACLSCYLSFIPNKDLMRPKLKQYVRRMVRPKAVRNKNFMVKVLSKTTPKNRFSDSCLVYDSASPEIKVDPGCSPYIYRNIIRYIYFARRDEHPLEPHHPKKSPTTHRSPLS